MLQLETAKQDIEKEFVGRRISRQPGGYVMGSIFLPTWRRYPVEENTFDEVACNLLISYIHTTGGRLWGKMIRLSKTRR